MQGVPGGRLPLPVGGGAQAAPAEGARHVRLSLLLLRRVQVGGGFFFFFFFGVFWGGTQPGVLLTSTTSLCHPPQCSSTVEAHLLKTHRLDLPAVDAVRMVADDFKVRRETYMYTGMRLNSS